MNVRGGRKGNNSNNSDQVAIAIDQDSHDHPLDEDDDKGNDMYFHLFTIMNNQARGSGYSKLN